MGLYKRMPIDRQIAYLMAVYGISKNPARLLHRALTADCKINIDDFIELFGKSVNTADEHFKMDNQFRKTISDLRRMTDSVFLRESGNTYFVYPSAEMKELIEQ